MARWLQQTVQGMLNPETADPTIPVIEAEFSKSGDPRYFWTETAITVDGEIALTWYDIGEPMLIHTNPGEGGRQYGVCTLLVPSARRASDDRRRPGRRQAGGDRARRPALQHLLPRLLGKLDRKEMSLARDLAEFLAPLGYDDLPPRATDYAAMIIASTFASAAYGTAIRSAQIIRELGARAAAVAPTPRCGSTPAPTAGRRGGAGQRACSAMPPPPTTATCATSSMPARR